MDQVGVDEQNVKQTMLEVISRYAEKGSQFQANSVLHETAESLNVGQSNDAAHQVVLTVWYDLFRTGIISWGLNLANPNPPFCHLTARGTSAMVQLSRDPSNPAGYLQHLEAIGALNAVAMSYLTEGLETYNASCHRAAAVMVGCASESLILEVRDALLAQLKAKNQPVAAKLQDWRVKTVLDQLATEIDSRLGSMPRPLQEEYSSYWAAFTGQIRMARNDAGHPTSIDPVTADTVHASLLIFPQLAKLSLELLAWIKSAV